MWVTTPPNESLPGEAREFDDLLVNADARWQFLFEAGGKIIVLDISGRTMTTLLDLPRVTGSTNAKILGDVILSPDSRRALVSWFVQPHSEPANTHLLLLDLQSGAVQDVSIPEDKFGLDGVVGNESVCNWLDERSFLVSLTFYPEKDASEYRKRLLRYRVDELAAPQPADLGYNRFVYVQPANGHPPMFADAHIEQARWRVLVATADGFRAASAQETAYFRDAYLKRTPNGPREMKVKLYFITESDLKFDLYQDGRWVRRSGEEIERTPAWDPRLRFYTWYEYGSSYTTFMMDEHGHYRRWARGHYIGKVPRGMLTGDQRR